MAMDLGLLYDFDLSFIPQSFLAAMGDSQTDLFSGDADMELLDKLETWSQNIQPISFHRTYNHYPWQEKQSPLQSFSLENEIFSDTSPLNLLLVSPKQTPTSLKILCQMTPTKKKCQKGTPPQRGAFYLAFNLANILALSDIPSGILSGISSGILSGISSGILSGISSGILSDMLSGVLSGISSGILSGR